MVASMAPEFTKKGYSSDYSFKHIVLDIYDFETKKSVKTIIRKHELDEFLHSDTCTYRINLNKAKDRWRKRQLEEFCENNGDSIQFENHKAFILYRCNMTRLDLEDSLFNAYLYKFENDKSGFKEIIVKFK